MAAADNKTCTAVAGCTTATSCCIALSVSPGNISPTANLVCLPVYTKVGAVVGCAVSSDCNTVYEA